MNPTLSRKTAFSCALLASVFAASTYAGPGLQYWANEHNKAEKSAAAVANPACPDSREVAVTTMKPAWANGRGPLTEVKTGTERVCHLCPVTTVTSATSWANGRGPVMRTKAASAGATHHCSTACITTSVASN